MGHPTSKQIGQCSVSVDEHGYPYWTRIQWRDGSISLAHEEARDLLYAMQRIVAYLDERERADLENAEGWRVRQREADLIAARKKAIDEEIDAALTPANAEPTAKARRE